MNLCEGLIPFVAATLRDPEEVRRLGRIDRVRMCVCVCALACAHTYICVHEHARVCIASLGTTVYMRI